MSCISTQSLLLQPINSAFEIDQTIFQAPTMENQNSPKQCQIKQNCDENRKNEVIELSSSHQSSVQDSQHESDLQIIQGNEALKNGKQQCDKHLNTKQVDQKEKKSRKLSPKCYICKKVGLRLESRQCTECKVWFHLDCLKNKDSKSSNKFLCQNCGPKPLSVPQTAQMSKKMALETKRAQKQKQRQIQLTLKFPSKASGAQPQKNQQMNRVLESFKERYPYYIDQNKITFPIDDKLILIYKELFDSQKQLPALEKPTCVPVEYLGDLLVIQNFCMSFLNEIQFTFYPSKQIIYQSFIKFPSDLCFKSLLYSLLIIYLGDIFDRNKTQNVKSLNENPFFELIHFLKQNEEMEQFLPPIWKQAIVRMQKIPSMSQAFDAINLTSNIETVEGKIHLIKELIMGLSQIDTFHDMMYKKTDKKQDLTKQRGQLVNQLKKDQADILTHAQTIKDNDHKLKQLQQQIDTSPKKQEINKLVRQQDRLRKVNSKIESQIEKSKQNVLKNKTRINEINKSIPFITGQIQLLGRDRNQSEYYLYSREPDRIYVNSRANILSESSFKVIIGKQKIQNYSKFLNQKGVKQRLLHGVITSHIKCGVIDDSLIQQEGSDKQPDTYEETTIQLRTTDIIDILNNCDVIFTQYLSKKNCRWDNPAKRQNFIQSIKNSDDLVLLKDKLKYMHEQFLYVENLGNGDQESDDAKSEKMDVQQQEEPIKRKRIRLWGIYFEKIKKYWIEYLQSCFSLQGLWISAVVFQHFVERYIRKKNQGAEERQRKLQKQLQKQRQRQKKQRHERLQRQKQERLRPKSQSVSSQQSKHRPVRPTTRGRLVRKSQRNLRQMNMKQPSSQSDYSQSQQSQQSHEDACQICGEFGQMLCCDTCPKVFHIECLKLKQIPDDEWSCVKCLQRMSNQRQTRSRAKKLYIQ